MSISKTCNPFTRISVIAVNGLKPKSKISAFLEIKESESDSEVDFLVHLLEQGQEQENLDITLKFPPRHIGELPDITVSLRQLSVLDKKRRLKDVIIFVANLDIAMRSRITLYPTSNRGDCDVTIVLMYEYVDTFYEEHATLKWHQLEKLFERAKRCDLPTVISND